ncbi:T9SS type A sorting domain-containing protein [Draconibacterium sp. IB214405]|uniref:T9SS type A sorting domain-containing protein n=1 Tax=Draconibacterium sp. IB214405 TaxID=3097352 RepID=UPI002A15F7DE|nr:T9SS type A sorting domain-containing protein [Draconibacterium sp. IB214405]MDX8340200.1 T9SS type A sorting domain-containing protein [Draconibacterium sp. IB214405]
MTQKIIIFLVLILSVFKMSATENHAAIEAADTAKIYEYRLSSDKITSPVQNKAALLRSNDHFSKSNFLNGFKTEVKSGFSTSSALWTLDSIVVRELNETTQLVENTLRQTLAAQNDGQNILVKNYNWLTDENHWLISDANYYFFSEAGRLDSAEFQEYITINYRVFTKTYYAYEDGLLKTEWSKEKFDEYDDWEMVERLEYNYDSISRLTQVNTREWDVFDDRWSTYEIVEYEYDSVGNIVAEIDYDYDSYEMLRTKIYEINYSYNAQNLLTEVAEYVEGWEDGTFIPDRKISYDYDESFNLEVETLYSWDYDLDGWLEDTRKEHFNERSGAQIHETLVQTWDDQWNDTTTIKYFAQNSVFADVVENKKFVFSFLPMQVFDNHVVDKIENYSYSAGEWEVSGTTTYHFTQNPPVGIISENLGDVKIFPNPATDYIQVQTNALQEFECVIYDLSGKIMLQERSNENLRLNVSGLESGYYLIEVREDGKKLKKGKFIKY